MQNLVGVEHSYLHETPVCTISLALSLANSLFSAGKLQLHVNKADTKQQHLIQRDPINIRKLK